MIDSQVRKIDFMFFLNFIIFYILIPNWKLITHLHKMKKKYSSFYKSQQKIRKNITLVQKSTKKAEKYISLLQKFENLKKISSEKIKLPSKKTKII